jgi:hypothetical protein
VSKESLKAFRLLVLTAVLLGFDGLRPKAAATRFSAGYLTSVMWASTPEWSLRIVATPAKLKPVLLVAQRGSIFTKPGTPYKSSGGATSIKVQKMALHSIPSLTVLW